MPLTPPAPQPPSPPAKLFKATEDLAKTVGAGVSFYSNGNPAVVQGSFEVASQNTSSPPTWITASVQGDNSNGYTVRVYERRAGCEGGTIFNARKSS